MPQLAFVMSPRQNWYLREFAETLRYELEQQGVPSTLHDGGFPEPRPDTVYVLVAPHEYVALEGPGALPNDQVLRGTIFLCAQPIDAIDPEQDAELLRNAGAVFDIDVRAAVLRRRAGIPARHLKPGYSRFRDRFDPEADRTIDVIFYGARSARRTRALARCGRTLASYNTLLQLSDDSLPNPGGSSSFIAEGKSDLLRRSKILLNVHRGDDTYLEWLRVLDAIHCGAVVVTEHSGGIWPLAAGEHLLVATPDSLPFVLDAALSDDKRLQQLRVKAHERIRAWLPFALTVSVFRATAVELVGGAVSPGVSLGRRTLPPPSGPVDSAGSEPNAGRMESRLKDVSREVVRLQRDVARLGQIVTSGSDTTPGRETLYETRPRRPLREPRVSVLTTIGNRSTVIAETLDSLSASRFRDFELVVVDDGSTDQSCEVVIEWLRSHPQVSAVVIRDTVSSGLGGARNAAVEHARAEYCLTLDAGDTIYPRCLEVLVGTLDGLPEPVFAYPILEVFERVEAFVAAGADYLLGSFGWEPGRLLRWTPVDAVAMIRTDRLRELGGFTDDLELSGWEDHNLWCRVAESGWSGQLVPQILGRYRASLHRVKSLSDVPPAEALWSIAPRD